MHGHHHELQLVLLELVVAVNIGTVECLTQLHHVLNFWFPVSIKIICQHVTAYHERVLCKDDLLRILHSLACQFVCA